MRPLRLIILTFLLIVPALTAAADPPPLSIRLLATNPSPYVGEEIALTLEITYLRHTGVRTAIAWPELLDLVAADPLQVDVASGRDAANRLVETVSRRIRPERSGRYEIGPVDVGNGTLHIATPPLTLRVRPLPLQDRPDTFSGLVGRYRLSLDADGSGPRELRVTIDDDTRLAPPPQPLASAFPGDRLTLLTTTTRALAGGGREHTLIYDYAPAGAQGHLPRFTLPVFAPQQQTYRVLTAGAAAPPPEGLPVSLLLVLLAVAAGLPLLYRAIRSPRSVDACLQRLCRRSPQGLSREQQLELLRPQLEPAVMTVLIDYWQRLDSRRFGAAALAVDRPDHDALRLCRLLRKVIDKQRRFP